MTKQGSSNTFRTITELAEAVGVDRKTAYNWTYGGVVEHTHYVGATAVFTQEEFEKAREIGLERKAALDVIRRG